MAGGKYISKHIARAVWGDKTVNELAKFVEKRYLDLKGYSRSALYKMKQFYETYWSSKIVSPVVRQFEITDIRASILCKITWTNHLIIITKTKTTEEREFYIRLCIQENYGKREMERQITTGVFERAILDKQELSSWPQTIKTNYVFEFLNLPGNHNENDLRTALIHQMKNFILELGKDFIFMGDEYRIKVGNSDFFIDLLFYQRGL